jgi:hypothetical protein
LRRILPPRSRGCSWDAPLPVPTPGFFVSVASKRLANPLLASVADKGVTRGQLRLKPEETRCWFVSVDSKEVAGATLAAAYAKLQMLIS